MKNSCIFCFHIVFLRCIRHITPKRTLQYGQEVDYRCLYRNIRIKQLP